MKKKNFKKNLARIKARVETGSIARAKLEASFPPFFVIVCGWGVVGVIGVCHGKIRVSKEEAWEPLL